MTLVDWERAFAATGQKRGKMRKRGKKIDVLTIKEGAQIHKVELRFDRESGDFIAELGSVEHASKNLAELRQKLQAKAKTLVAYEYRWYIEVRYDVDETNVGDMSWSQRSEFDEMETGHVVCGINFRFHVVERSQAIRTDETGYNNRPYYMRMQRDVEEDEEGVLRVKESVRRDVHKFVEGDDDEDDFIEYTPERHAKLKAIREKLTELARRLHEVVGKKATDTARMLDSMTAQPLLLAAASSPTPAEQEKPLKKVRKQ